MRDTLTRPPRKNARPATRPGKPMTFTEPSQPHAEISRQLPTVEVSPDELRRGEVSDQAILEALALSRQ